jgi:hypothetical protein
MTLINPTDDELNRAFAEKVAGWNYQPKCLSTNPEDRTETPMWFVPARGDAGPGYEYALYGWTRSMDAVLPWLEKWRDSGKGYVVMATIHSAAMKRTGWIIQIRDSALETNNVKDFEVIDWSASRACVIALLRAHGVVVEFTP